MTAPVHRRSRHSTPAPDRICGTPDRSDAASESHSLPHIAVHNTWSSVVPLIAGAAAAPTAAFVAVVVRSVTTGILIALLMFAAVILAARMI
ncbi:hypothetical protein [Rhodococcus opacus]|uniref:hypothetical protein n=1 Tax=Rhodococcus opacus TaxID=37919 RepID=UPI002235ACE4|nr:hypothetical protein [Rhodococcus opacus]UZG59839.1 hypothetical protein ONE62_39525 [Rhodococcus opacus]